MPKIELTRPPGYRVDGGRSYEVFVDEVSAGSIKSGENKVFGLPTGQHDLQLKLDSGSSETIQFDLPDGPAWFTCGPRIKRNDVSFSVGIQALYWMTIGRRRYIDLCLGHELSTDQEPLVFKWLNGWSITAVGLLVAIFTWVALGAHGMAKTILIAVFCFVVGGLVVRDNMARRDRQTGRRAGRGASDAVPDEDG